MDETEAPTQCPQCGAGLAEGATICPQCGAEVGPTASASAVSAVVLSPDDATATNAVATAPELATAEVPPVATETTETDAADAVAEPMDRPLGARPAEPASLALVPVSVARAAASQGGDERRRGWALALSVALLVMVGTGAIAGVALARGMITLPGSARQSTQFLPYHRTLQGDTSDWPADANCVPQGDGYHINGSVACYPRAATTADATISVAVQALKGDRRSFYGIAFRRTGTGSHYLFGINANGQWLAARYDNGQPHLLVKPIHSAAITTGASPRNTLKVVARGSDFAFYVNGIEVGTAHDATYHSGSFGLEGGTNAEVVFSDFSVQA